MVRVRFCLANVLQRAFADWAADRAIIREARNYYGKLLPTAAQTRAQAPMRYRYE